MLLAAGNYKKIVWLWVNLAIISNLFTVATYATNTDNSASANAESSWDMPNIENKFVDGSEHVPFFSPDNSPEDDYVGDSNYFNEEIDKNSTNNNSDLSDKYPPLKRIQHPAAVFYGLDKISGHVYIFTVPINETYQFGSLQITPKVCLTSAPNEPDKTDAYVLVKSVTLDKAIKPLFAGWLFSRSPSLNYMDHPVYDVWLKDCAALPSLDK